MASSIINNPSGAFGVTDLDQKLFKTTGEFVASAAITAKSVVSISSTGTVATTTTGGVGVIGVALNAASGADKTIQVILTGIATNMVAGGATTLGTPVIRSATTSGAITSSATPVTGTVVGFALGASAGGLTSVWVLPGSNTSS